MRVAAEHRHRSQTGMVRGIDVVSHVADKRGFTGVETVVAQNPKDQLTLVQHPGVSLFEEALEPKLIELRVERRRIHAGEDKGADAVGLAPSRASRPRQAISTASPRSTARLAWAARAFW